MTDKQQTRDAVAKEVCTICDHYVTLVGTEKILCDLYKTPCLHVLDIADSILAITGGKAVNKETK